MRLLALLLWHHFAFFIIGAAILGFSAAGLWLSLVDVNRRRVERKAAPFMLWFALASLALVFAWSAIPIRYIGVSWWVIAAELCIYFFCLFIPFFFAGAVVVMAFIRCEGRAGRVYFANMLGSGVGCWLAVLLIPALGADRSLILMAALASISALFSAHSSWRGRFPAVLAGVLLTVSALTGIPRIEWWSAENKVLGAVRKSRPAQPLLYSKWDTNARIDVVRVKLEGTRVGKLLRKFFPVPEGKVPLLITIDGDAATYIPDFPKGYANTDFFKNTAYGIGYMARQPRDVLIIGLGGGIDVMAALRSGAEYIDGVEINRRIIEVVRDVFPEQAEHIYQDPKVQIHHSEGRSFISRTRRKYDHIQMTGVDTWTALSSGAYILSENYLYTREAFNDLLDRLNPNGTITIVRWLFSPPRECLRICATAVAAFRNRGIENPHLHFIVLNQKAFGAITIKNTPYTPDELDAINRRIESADTMKWIYRPGGEEHNPFSAYFDSVARGEESSFIEKYRFNIEPTTDNRPFFYNYYRWKNLLTDFKRPGVGWRLQDLLPLGNLAILGSIFTALFFVLLFLILPLFIRRMRGSKIKFSAPAAVFFLAIGMGFILIEISLIQKFVLFLGHPTLSVSVTIASLLCFASLGSRWSGVRPMPLPTRMFKLTLVLVACAIFWGFAMDPVLNALLGLPVKLRVLTTVLIVAPGAVAMGMAFPSGLETARRRDPALIPWGWALNGSASVLGSSGAVMLAMHTGFSSVLVTGALFYSLATLAGRKM